jgi:hypothetical protein
MESSTLIKLGLLLAAVAIVGAGAYMAYDYFGKESESPRVKITSPEVNYPPERPEQPRDGMDDFEEITRREPQLRMMLPASDEEGQPFVLTDASEHANNAFKALREKRFQQAVMEYEMAAELDPRYESTLRRTEKLVEGIRTLGFERAKNQRVFPGDRLTYKQLYGWD